MDVSEFLNQGDVWIVTEGQEVKISDMTDDHAMYAARWLKQNATGLILIVEAKRNEDAVNREGHVKDVLALVAQHPREWIVRTPLYQALAKVAFNERNAS